MEDTVRTILIVAAVAVILVLLMCCVAWGVIVVLALMAPSVGNVFSNIITALPSPTPAVVP